MPKLILYTSLMAILLTSPAYAYIGPGAGAGTIAVVLGVIASFFLALFAILWYPLKRMIKKLKSSAKKAPEINTDSK